MATTNTRPSFPVAAACSAYLRVKKSGGQLALCSATDKHIGTTATRTTAAGELVAIIPQNESGTRKYVASGVIAVDVDVYGAANGKVGTTTGGGQEYIGKSVIASAADGDVIEVAPVAN